VNGGGTARALPTALRVIPRADGEPLRISWVPRDRGRGVEKRGGVSLLRGGFVPVRGGVSLLRGGFVPVRGRVPLVRGRRRRASRGELRRARWGERAPRPGDGPCAPG